MLGTCKRDYYPTLENSLVMGERESSDAEVLSSEKYLSPLNVKSVVENDRFTLLGSVSLCGKQEE